ncbi:hypothetical protein CERSUDRAFT_117433 [Gelatoporia subvermispora B]|uniref:DUF453-domain-containing protein n=1 Tax=Ceriporiopsis subvermispora (strain B) TaxID=914234 RepID=M2QAF5_CERS8|nr:hypothetical protein CERSUDRAFT_117433 [Gelatoporia subvermispora B]
MLSPLVRVLRRSATTLRAPHARCASSGVSNPIPATFMRGGTSKGIFLARDDLPSDPEEWSPIFLGIMGSPDPEYGRQLNGMGGGVSSLSKVMVVGAPTDEQKALGADVAYTFVQVGIRDEQIDLSGNCGNLSSMVGVFAVDRNLCKPAVSQTEPPRGTVRAYNTNTEKLVVTSFPVEKEEDRYNPILDLPEAAMAGVHGKASRILLEFPSPSGARTGALLPSGMPTDYLQVESVPNGPSAMDIPASCVDATNPTVFIAASDLRAIFKGHDHDPLSSPSLFYADPVVRQVVENIRRSGAECMGLDPDMQAQPKISVLSPPPDAESGIVAHSFSMGVLHKAIPMTVGLCLAVAARVPNTLAWDIVHSAERHRKAETDPLRIIHPSGYVDVGVDMDAAGDVKSVKVVRTGRRLMTGLVWW